MYSSQQINLFLSTFFQGSCTDLVEQIALPETMYNHVLTKELEQLKLDIFLVGFDYPFKLSELNGSCLGIWYVDINEETGHPASFPTCAAYRVINSHLISKIEFTSRDKSKIVLKNHGNDGWDILPCLPTENESTSTFVNSFTDILNVIS